MLYITTRGTNDVYTAHRAMHENLASDGGGYIPFRLPFYSSGDLDTVTSGSFNQTIAQIINQFFSLGLSGWDIDFCIGRSALKLIKTPHRIVVAEVWHNLDGVYEHICMSIFQKVRTSTTEEPSDWFKIAVNIAVIFGIYGELRKENAIQTGEVFDVSVRSNDLFLVSACVYAKKMGLPINTVIISEDEGGRLWDLIHLGECNVSNSAYGYAGLERLIYERLGSSGVEALCRAVNEKKPLRINPEILPDLRDGLFCSVSGNERGLQTINSIYRNNAYILDCDAARCVAGLQDYRAKTGISNTSVILSCISPSKCSDQICTATGITAEKLNAILSNR